MIAVDASTLRLTREPGRLERLYLARQERDLAACTEGDPVTGARWGHPRGLRWDPAAGERVVQFIENYCRHHKGEWRGQLLTLEPWQRQLVRILFGWLRADGTRRFRKAWIEVPRKNGKTELAAAIALYMLIADGEPGADCYATATKKEQAQEMLFDAAKQMVENSPELSRFVTVNRSQGGTLVVSLTASKLTTLASDSTTQDGLSPHFDGRDEVHAWKDPRLAEVLDTAMGARRQPLTLEITTAGTADPEAVGWTHHEYAVQVLEGVVEDDRQFVFVAAIDDDDNAWDPLVWAKANPNLGISPKYDYIAEQAAEAKRRPSETNKFLRLHCNRWTQQIKRWLSVERWNECDTSQFYDPGTAQLYAPAAARLGKLDAYGGLDLSSKLDLAAFSVVWPEPDGWLSVLCRFWLPEDTIAAQVKQGRTHYQDWMRAGWIKATPGEIIDYGYIRNDVNELAAQLRLREVGYDPWNATQIATQLQEDGLRLVETRQGAKTLSEPCKLWEAAIVARKVRWGGNPVLRWCVANAVVRTDPNGGIAPDKAKATGKIDGVVSTVIALSRIVAAKKQPNPYAKRGIRFL